jgi:hypothetical protein
MNPVTLTAIHPAASPYSTTGRLRRTRPNWVVASSLQRWSLFCFRVRQADIFSLQLGPAVPTATSSSTRWQRQTISNGAHPALRRGGAGNVLGMVFIASSLRIRLHAIPGSHAPAPNNALQRTEAGDGLLLAFHILFRQPLSLSLSPLGD